jgi:hypothetical protein
MIDASVNRVLHGPTLRLRQAASVRAVEALSLEQLTLGLTELFELSSGASMADDAEMSVEDEPLPSGPETSEIDPQPASEAAEGDAPAQSKRRAHSEAR